MSQLIHTIYESHCYLQSRRCSPITNRRTSQLFAYIEQYHASVTPERVFHLEEIVVAHQYVESSEGYGKVVVVN
ncbi:zinc-binding dehydrogenase [Capnocytophaga granulosa]